VAKSLRTHTHTHTHTHARARARTERERERETRAQSTEKRAGEKMPQNAAKIACAWSCGKQYTFLENRTNYRARFYVLFQTRRSAGKFNITRPLRASVCAKSDREARIVGRISRFGCGHAGKSPPSRQLRGFPPSSGSVSIRWLLFAHLTHRKSARNLASLPRWKRKSSTLSGEITPRASLFPLFFLITCNPVYAKYLSRVILIIPLSLIIFHKRICRADTHARARARVRQSSPVRENRHVESAASFSTRSRLMELIGRIAPIKGQHALLNSMLIPTRQIRQISLGRNFVMTSFRIVRNVMANATTRSAPFGFFLAMKAPIPVSPFYSDGRARK